METRPPLPPFTTISAAQKVRAAEDGWNSRDQQRIASINDLPIEEGDRLFHWSQGRRPDDHPGLSDLGL